MAIFQLRKGRDEQSVPAAPPPTVEALRRRAIHRLIGAAVLVLAGVIGFPLFFDNQPRPIPLDLPVVIPDKTKVPVLIAPPAAPAIAAAPVAGAVVAPPLAIQPVAAVTAAAPAPAIETTPATLPATTAAKSAPAAPAATVSSAADAGKARALLEGKQAAPLAPATEGRFIVQVGAFSDAEKVREVRRKVEAVGLKTYTQVVETKEGSRIRVRVGPYADKAEANQIADRIKKLGLSAAILSL